MDSRRNPTFNISNPNPNPGLDHSFPICPHYNYSLFCEFCSHTSGSNYSAHNPADMNPNLDHHSNPNQYVGASSSLHSQAALHSSNINIVAADDSFLHVPAAANVIAHDDSFNLPFSSSFNEELLWGDDLNWDAVPPANLFADDAATAAAHAAQYPAHAAMPRSINRGHINSSAEDGGVDVGFDHQRVGIRVQGADVDIPDGYEWRKYGEKAIKHKRYKRNYFRCANAGCGVTKYAERCSEDSTYVNMTYNGRHNHSPP